MKTSILSALVPVLIAGIPPAAGQDRAAHLEARLKETAESSPPAARMMLELIGIYEGGEKLFGIIRTAGKFSRAQTKHPERP
ncbi:MAG: hypothetical protein VYC95_10755, partial [Verrucomicrobiota bacterium]|nr:hypothetical protein [Verrucomicrobiota bacterium]